MAMQKCRLGKEAEVHVLPFGQGLKADREKGTSRFIGNAPQIIKN